MKPTDCCPFGLEDVVEKRGRPMKIFTRTKGAAPEHLSTLYSQVKEEEIPLNFTGDIHYMLNKEKYETVISNANLEIMRESYCLHLRPWQVMVVNDLYHQDDRSILWVFDFNGNTGKSELSRYLMMKLNYQVLKPADTHDLCGLIDSRADGYAFDLPRSGVSKINDFFRL